MFFIKTLIVCEEEVKRQILQNESGLARNKYMSRKQFIDTVICTFHEHCAIALMNEYNLSIENAKIYLESIQLMKDCTLNNEKLNLLQEMYGFLKQKNLVILNNFILTSFKQVIIYNYLVIDSLFKKAIDISSNILKVEIRQYQKNEKKYHIYKFNHLIDEARYVFKEISSLLCNGINPNNIKVINLSNDYEMSFEMLSNMYDIQFNYKMKQSIISNQLSLEVLKMAKNNHNIQQIYEYIKDCTNVVRDKIIAILNKYFEVKEIDLYHVLKYSFLNTNYDEIKYDHAIERYSFDDYIPHDEDIVFLMGFNQGGFPRDYFDEDFIGDNIKKDLGLKLTSSYSYEEENNILSKLSNIKNLFISYKEASYFNKYSPSNLINKMDCQNSGYHFDVTKSYSVIDDLLLYAINIDTLIKSNQKSNIIDVLASNYELKYNSYKNKYQKITDFHLDNLRISYTSLNTFYHCKFRYYLNYILKLEKYEEDFKARIGSAMHKILQESSGDNFDFDKIFNEIKGDFTNGKEAFFFELLKENVNQIILFNQEYEANSNVEVLGLEEKIEVHLEDNVSLVGYIDKLYKSKSKEMDVIAVIDYKTGNTKASLDNIEHGLNMQLPMYLYLLKHSKYKDYHIGGFYIQHLLKEVSQSKVDMKTDYKRFLKFAGYSNSNQQILALMDCTFEKSEYIQGMAVKKDGEFDLRSKIITIEEIDSIIQIIENNIQKAYKNILEGNFDIDPISINDKNIGCDYCSFEDICFKKYQDFRRTSEIKYKKKGEENA